MIRAEDLELFPLSSVKGGMKTPTQRLACALVLPLLVSLASCGAGPAGSKATAQPDLSAFDYDAKAPLDVQISSTEKKDGLTRHTLTYASPRGGRVPAMLIVPDGKGPFAGMLLMHGAPGNYGQMIPEAEDLARRGTLALLIDAPFSRGDRKQSAPLRFDEQDRADQIQLIVDLRRGIDLLLARPEVDPKRLGFLGISYGGAMGGLLAGVDNRIAAYALAVGDGGIVSHFTGADDTNGPLQQMPKEYASRWLERMEPIEPIRFIGRAAPAHILFQNGRQDTMVPPADAEAYQKAASEPKKVLWYDAGHGLNRQAIVDRHEWLTERLGLTPSEPASGTPGKPGAPTRPAPGR